MAKDMDIEAALRPDAFFDLGEFEHRDFFLGAERVWDALKGTSQYIDEHLIPNLGGLKQFREPLSRTTVLFQGKALEGGFEILEGDPTKGKLRVRIEGEETSEAAVLYAGTILWDERIHVGPGSLVEPGALIKGPTIIGPMTEIRQGAYIRGRCLVGARCVVGHTTEMKFSVMLNGAKAGHFAYIGDSILGNDTNLGAGTKLANLKVTEGNVTVRIGTERMDTGLRKFGAIIGDGTEIGCNTVTNPGTLLGKLSIVTPVASVRTGYHGRRSLILK